MVTLSKLEHAPLRDALSDAIRYWERRRIAFNLLLAAVVTGWGVAAWPYFRAALTFEPVLALVVLAVLANACYCAAYLVDLPMQCSAYRAAWRRRRWMLWTFGTLFAMALAYYWMADEIYPAVRAMAGA